MLLSLVILLIIVGIVLYLIGMVPMDQTILQLIRVVVILATVLYVIKALGLLSHLPALR